MMKAFQFIRGTRPLLVSMPHTGTAIPADLQSKMTAHALTTPDTDWHIHKLYDFVQQMGASVLIPNCSRFVIDLNRDPSDKVLYPGADNTKLCPETTFGREAIYKNPQDKPDAAEIERRTEIYWRPYHEKLIGELAEMRQAYGIAVLFDAHSIRSEVPRFFEGELPHLNLGTADGRTAAADLEGGVWQILNGSPYSSVQNGRFKGGFITRHYGEPANHVHALQLEIGQRAYMDEAPPYPYDPEKAEALQTAVLRPLMERILKWADGKAKAHA